MQAFARVSLARDPITSLIFWIRSETLHWPLIERRRTKNRQKVREARRPDLLHPHLRKALLEPALHPLAVLGRIACPAGSCNGDFKLCKCILRHYRLIFVLEMFISCAGELVEVGGQDGSLSSC
jgi:hypothetical protein